MKRSRAKRSVKPWLRHLSPEHAITIAGVALILLALLCTLTPLGETLAGAAFGRPLRCGNAVCNIQESALSCPSDCACASAAQPAKRWLGGAACCPGTVVSNNMCCPLGTAWNGTNCTVVAARADSPNKIVCTPQMRKQGQQGWITCPNTYSPICTFTADGHAMATLPSDCQACVDGRVAFYVRGECAG